MKMVVKYCLRTLDEEEIKWVLDKYNTNSPALIDFLNNISTYKTNWDAKMEVKTRKNWNSKTKIAANKAIKMATTETLFASI